jgi:hypothetical protein
MCPIGYQLVTIGEKWVTVNNFTYLHRSVRCEKLPTGPIHPLFYIIGGICLVLWIVLLCVICWCCRSEPVAPCPSPNRIQPIVPSLGLSPSPSQQDLGLSQREHRIADVGP